MKKLFLFSLFAVFLFGASCSREELPVSEPAVFGVSPASDGAEHRVPVDSALSSLNSVLASLDGGSTRSGMVRSIRDISVVKAADVLSATRAAETPDVEDLVYIANFGNDEGYAILAADDRLEPVIAITEQGSLTPAEFKAVADGEYDLSQGDIPPMFPEIAAYAMRIGTIGGGTGGIGGGIGGGTGGIGGGGTGGGNFGWQGGLVDWQGNPDKPQDRVTIEDKEWTPETKVGPYVHTKWGQNAPYNYDIPKINGQYCKVGCQAIAVTQVIAANKYMHNQPQSSSLVFYKANADYINHPERDFYWVGFTPILRSIDNFRARSDKGNGFFSSDDYKDYEKGIRKEEVSAVANFVYAAGMAMGLEYGVANSGGSTGNACVFLSKIGYKNVKVQSYSGSLVDMMINERSYPHYSSRSG